MTLVLASTFAAASSEQPVHDSLSGPIPQIRFEKYTLPNGLQVILHEDHSTPIVGVNVWYHVGSKNERPGRTGFAHLFEHMMFQGSKHWDRDYFAPLQEAGGRLNGSTNQDRTNYWETVPANYLELALWMESDRMGFLLPAMTQAKLDNQRSVVKNERRQSYENRPYGLAFEMILAAVYPPDHPYSWPTIGSMTDLNKASREDIADFFRRYYHPANASLCIAGDFDPAAARRWVEKYFGPIPAGPKVEKIPAWTPPLKEARRIRMADRVGLSRIYFAWQSVPMFAADDAELEILADVLAGGKTSRLYRSLVREKQIAQDVQAYQSSEEIAGGFMIVATARPGHTPAELQTAIDAELKRIEAEPPSAEEVARAVNQTESHFVRALQPISEFGGRADRLNMYNTFTADPGYLVKDFQRYLRVDPQGVRRVASKYLIDKRMVLEVVPGKETAIDPDPRIPAEEAREQLAKNIHDTFVPAAAEPAEDADRTARPNPASALRFALPPLYRGRLANGIEVLVVQNHTLPTVNVNLVVPAGRSADPALKPGLAQLTSLVLDEGTQRRDSQQIADELAGMGAHLSVGADWDSTAVRLFTLKRHFSQALDIYADVIQHPAFPEAELKRERAMALARLVQVRDEPTALASMATAAMLYGEGHPYGQPQFGTPASLKSIDRADLECFYRTHIRPDRSVLIVVGDVAPAELIPELEKSFADWKPATATAQEQHLPAPPEAKPTNIVLVDKPGAAQSVIAASLIGADRNSPDYHALAVMNSIFGGQFSSRLNLNLREQKGYTYGARTSFDWRVLERGPFVASSSVQTAVTAPALVEFLKEFEGMSGARPVTAAEVEFSKAYLVRGYPAGFETPAQVASQLETLVEFHLPAEYFDTFIPKISAVTPDDVSAVAKKYLHAGNLAIVVVGDCSKIESSLRALPIGKRLAVCHFDENFRLAPGR